MNAALSPDDAAAQRICMYGTQDHHCGNAAVVHVLVQPGQSMHCRRHFEELTKQGEAIDFHPIGDVCGLPGTVWHDSTIPMAGDGTCSMDWGDDDLEGLIAFEQFEQAARAVPV